jgi:H+-translocating NAD(P) transhydrogenase subunit alpha
MPVVIAVPRETWPGERRTAMIPEVAKKLTKLGANLVLQQGATDAAYIAESEFPDVKFVPTTGECLGGAQVVLAVQPPDAATLNAIPDGAVLLSYLSPGKYPERVKILKDKKITSFAMELVPRTTRGQAMDALSSQASVSGYQIVLMAAQLCPKFFPMLTTAAGTIRPAKVVVIGAGVAGLQAIATARRLGAMVEAYDVRSATKEQVESLGAKFISAVQGAEGSGGYARELSEEEKAQQQVVLAKHVAAADALITTAAIPGRPAPRIISEDMVKAMKPGSVVVDLAADSGGNTWGVEAGATVVKHGVTLHGPVNVPATMPLHASLMYSKNLFNFLELIVKDGALQFDWDDEILKGMIYTKEGRVMHEPSRKSLGEVDPS